VKYPNTKNVFMILIAIILVGAAFLFAEYRNKGDVTTYSKNNISAQPSDYIEPQNTQSNTDWKKVLLANETVGSSTIKDLTKRTGELEPIDAVSRQFFAQYMELRQLGSSNDKLSQQELIEKTISSMTLATPKPYVIGQIVTKLDISNEAIRQYGNDIGDIFKKYGVQSRNEGVIVRDSQLKEDPSILKELDPIAESYKKIISALLKLSVPKTIETLHLDIINSMNKGLFVVESFKKSDMDPVSGLQAVSQYQSVSSSLTSSLMAIRKYIASLGIVYSPNEAGYIFTK
jgi:hypothetical protein